VLPEIQNLKIQVAKLKKEKEELKESLDSTQAEVEGLKEQAAATTATLKATTHKMVKLEELGSSNKNASTEEITSNSSALLTTSRNPQKTQKEF